MKTVFHKIKKIILWAIGIAIVFVILVVVLVDRDEETGKISISFSNKGTKISNVGFTNLISDELGLVEIGKIDWSEAYNKALDEKYSVQTPSSNFQQEPSALNNREDEQGKKNEIFKTFIQYLAASETKLDENKNPFELALQYRNENQKDKIGELISDLDKKIIHVESITPPEEVVGYHLAKLELLRETKKILGTIEESENKKPLEEIVSEKQFEHLAKLSLILKEYLTYFFYKG